MSGPQMAPMGADGEGAMDKQQALSYYDEKLWEPLTYRQRAELQMLQPLLCMPFSVLHEALEKTLGRRVYTHEFALNYGGLKAELFDGNPSPDLLEILNLIPEDKHVVILGSDEQQEVES